MRLVPRIASPRPPQVPEPEVGLVNQQFIAPNGTKNVPTKPGSYTPCQLREGAQEKVPGISNALLLIDGKILDDDAVVDIEKDKGGVTDAKGSV